jgi:hypothetical protein
MRGRADAEIEERKKSEGRGKVVRCVKMGKRCERNDASRSGEIGLKKGAES